MQKRRFINLTILTLIFMVCILFAHQINAATVRPQTLQTLEFYGASPYKVGKTIRTSAILTNSYVDTDILITKELSKVAVLFDLTQGVLTSVEYRVFISPNGVDWFIEATETVAAGTITDDPANGTVTLSGDTKYFKIFNCYAPYMKLSIKGTGTVTASAAVIHVLGVI